MNEPVRLIALTEKDYERFQHYAAPSYGSGGFQNLLRKLLKQEVEIGKDGELVYVSREPDLFDEQRP